MRRARGPQRHGRRFAIVPSRETEPFPKLRSAAGPRLADPSAAERSRRARERRRWCPVRNQQSRRGPPSFRSPCARFRRVPTPETAVGPCKLHVPVFTLRVSSAGELFHGERANTSSFRARTRWLEAVCRADVRPGTAGEAGGAKDKRGVMCTIAPKQLVELIYGAPELQRTRDGARCCQLAHW